MNKYINEATFRDILNTEQTDQDIFTCDPYFSLSTNIYH